MKLYNIKQPTEQVDYHQAVRQGLGQGQGLFFPRQLPFFTDIDALLAQDFVSRSALILSRLIGDEIAPKRINEMVDSAFTFSAPVVNVDKNINVLELFHGPTLAFKDFGARFMAQSLATVATDAPITILTATSGDTGAAVAHAFYGVENIKVVILYPKGKISPLQEKLFCTLGDNISTIAIDGSFDDCQALVKQAFDDNALKAQIGLNSANSINISRLVAQICYYFEAVAQIAPADRQKLVISVPSGNFGNLTAGLLAKAMGLPVKRFVVATNDNDTVVRYLADGNWKPNQTVATLSNAMDVSEPNNWPRIETLFAQQNWPLSSLHATKVSQPDTVCAMQHLHQAGYIADPHAAVAYHALQANLADDEIGLFLATAHPAKFQSVVEQAIDSEVKLPAELAECENKPLLSVEMKADFSVLADFLRQLR